MNTPLFVPALLLLAALLLTATTAGAEERASITVDVTGDSRPLPRAIFGTFLEPILSAIYGGLWAQELVNPGFEPNPWSPRNIEGMLRDRPELRSASDTGIPLPWEALDAAQGWRCEPRLGDSANGAGSLCVMAMPSAQTGVRQKVFLPVHRSLRYTGSLHVKHVSGNTDVEVSLRRRDKPGEVLAKASLQAPSRSWARHDFALELPRDKVAPLEPLDFVVALRDGGRALLDQVFLFPADHVRGMDPEMVALLRGLKSPVVRYGGNFTSGYHWKDGVGPIDKRWPMVNQSWGIPEYNHFGTDEFLQFCDLVGSEPQFAVNLGSGTPKEAEEWVRYVTPRVGNGKGGLYWELGNELWGTGWQIGYPTREELAKRTLEFSKAVRKADPKARLVATGGDPEWFHDWNAELLKLPAGTFDLISTHFVCTTESVRRKDATPEFIAEASFALPVGLERLLLKIREQIDASPEHKGRVGVAFTEWLFIGPPERVPDPLNLGGAVVTAGMLNTLMRTSSFVTLSNMTGTVEFHGVRKRQGRVFAVPSYWALRMYSTADADRFVNVRTDVATYDVREGNNRIPEIPGTPLLDVTAALNAKGDTLTLFCVNRSPKQPVRASLGVGPFTRGGTVSELVADTIHTINNEERPDAVVPRARPVPDGTKEHVFPPASVTVLALRRG